MVPNVTQAEILAFAVLELRVLLAGHLGTGTTQVQDPPARAAAHLAFALHNQAIAVLEGRSFDPADAVNALAHVDAMLGENFVQTLSQHHASAAHPAGPAPSPVVQRAATPR